MGHFNKTIIIIIILLGFLASVVQGQNYRDQKKLIRLKPNNLLVFGQILTPSDEPISGASISLFDPPGAKIIETIPVDDLGEFLFTLEKGKTFGLIIEKEGFFPYYSQFTVPTDLEEEWEKSIQLPDGLQNRYKLLFPFKSNDPANPEIINEIANTLSGFSKLEVWIPEEIDSLFPLRINRIKNILLEAGIESHRLYIGIPPGNADQVIHLQMISENTLDDQNDTAGTEENTSEDPVTPDKWTLQFVASKNKLQSSSLKGIINYKVFHGKDGFYRYTYGIYNSKKESEAGKALLKSKGFSQPFAKKIEDLQKL